MRMLSTKWMWIVPVAFSACSSPQPQAANTPDTRAADEAAIRKADTEWLKVGQAKQVDDWLGFYSDDAVVLPPNETTATTKDQIRKTVSELLGLPGLTIDWQLTKVDVARSGDLGYGYGTYKIDFKDPKSGSGSDHGKILEVWKKQADGNWKCVADTWSSDLPPAPPSK
jgi:ketosteroid isomerase-like protein